MKRRHEVASVFAILLLSVLIWATYVAHRHLTAAPGSKPYRGMMKSARGCLSNLNMAIQMYAEDCGHPPSQSSGLGALMTDPGVTGWAGPYLTGRGLPYDPWGTPFRYSLREGVPHVSSAGPDMKFDTQDDILTEAPNKAMEASGD